MFLKVLIVSDSQLIHAAMLTTSFIEEIISYAYLHRHR